MANEDFVKVDAFSYKVSDSVGSGNGGVGFVADKFEFVPGSSFNVPTQERIDALEALLANTESKVSELTSDLARREKIIDGLKGSLEDQQNAHKFELGEARGKLSSAHAQRDNLESKVNNLTNLNEVLKYDNARYIGQLEMAALLGKIPATKS